MQGSLVQQHGQRAFGVALKDLAASGSAPVVLQDCLRWLALRGLTTPRLFSTPVVPGEKRKLQALRHLYDTGRRPLRSKSCRDKDPHLIANLLLMWLGSLPEPLFPAALVPALVESQQSDYYDERIASVRALLKQAEPFVIEALFPLFELLHHYWINQADRDSTLQHLSVQLAPAVFGTPAAHGLPPEDGGLLSDTVEMLISEYRPLFTQPFNLRRFEADAARQAAAEAQRAEAAEAAASAMAAAALASPLLTPIRCERLSVMAPEGTSPFSDCCATPLPESPFSSYCADGNTLVGSWPPVSLRASPAWEAAMAEALPFSATAPLGPFTAPATAPSDLQLEQAFTDLLQSTVSAMLFEAEVPPTPPPEEAAGPSAKAMGASTSAAADADTLMGCDEQPMSPVAVLRGMGRDGGDESADSSDCEAATGMGSRHTFAWQRASACGLPTC